MRTRAILITRHGPPRTLVEREVDLPDPGPGQVHVKVEAAGVNFADLLMRAGLYGTVPPRPYSPGFEIAGTVARVGPGVTEWREGDRAAALLRYGGYARDVIVSEQQAFRIPGGLAFVTAAAVPVTYLTAWVCLFTVAHARAGDRVLILGAAGGVGTAAVQLARQAGLTVFGTAGSPRKRDFVTDVLGATACFDSRGSWEREARETIGERAVDIAMDPVGGPATAACRRLMAPLGRVVFYGLSSALPHDRRSWPRAILAWLRTARIHPASLVEPCIGVHGVHLLHLGTRESVLREALPEMVERIQRGSLSPVIDRTFSLDAQGASEAHAYLHGRRNLGKVVLTTNAD